MSLYILSILCCDTYLVLFSLSNLCSMLCGRFHFSLLTSLSLLTTSDTSKQVYTYVGMRYGVCERTASFDTIVN